MNRIVIIGNGFDLAHGLPTSYENFLSYLKKETFALKRECDSDFNFMHYAQNDIEDNWLGIRFKDKQDDIIQRNLFPKRNYLDFYSLDINNHGKPRSIYFKSLFEEKADTGNWSDLESHYFKVISEHKETSADIQSINTEFSHLKKLLEQYLISQVEEGLVFNETEIYESMKLLLTHTSRRNQKFEQTYFVTFNYTSKLLEGYFNYFRGRAFGPNSFKIKPIHIHGKLLDGSNPIIFGYGDDNSSEYNAIKDMQNNELLINFKTFQYLRNNEYKKVLGLLENKGGNYIQIIGHSCGLGDKTLLRTIFQHNNSKRIESVYHENESNYFENLYNISRIFDDTELMRSKLIPLGDTFMLQ